MSSPVSIDLVHDQFADVVYIPGTVGNHSLQLAIDVHSDMTVLLSTNTTCPEENGGYCPFPISYVPQSGDTLLVGNSSIPFAIANTTTTSTDRFSPAELASQLKQLSKVANDTYAVTNRSVIVAPSLEGYNHFPSEVYVNDKKYDNITLDYTVSGIGIDGDVQLKCGDSIKVGSAQFEVPSYGDCDVKRFNQSEGLTLGWDALAHLNVVFEGSSPKYYKASTDDTADTSDNNGDGKAQSTSAGGDQAIVTQSKSSTGSASETGKDAKSTENAANGLSASILLIAALLL
ncbi:hypothetical protein DIURU_005362 [Diutina rugosa]|uniref:Uncharacterized protein n=1 Tax=Diutina rugosa TaxID=5481 RepID=A0A642UDF2_DIURU|nr:uncharacterized protein DIURU_005362 [Diutina rugosa]KAA8897129.1 hypothetical protein DIURU_005362 [Diutina rugosa]